MPGNTLTQMLILAGVIIDSLVFTLMDHPYTIAHSFSLWVAALCISVAIVWLCREPIGRGYADAARIMRMMVAIAGIPAAFGALYAINIYGDHAPPMPYTLPVAYSTVRYTVRGHHKYYLITVADWENPNTTVTLESQNKMLYQSAHKPARLETQIHPGLLRASWVDIREVQIKP
jgi:hypothetical protein